MTSGILFGVVAAGTAVVSLLAGIAIVVALAWRENPWQLLFQRAFVACLMCLAAFTLLAMQWPEPLWLMSGAAFSALAVAATVDLQQRRTADAAE
jgi:hypothetical protein